MYNDFGLVSEILLVRNYGCIKKRMTISYFHVILCEQKDVIKHLLKSTYAKLYIYFILKLRSGNNRIHDSVKSKY